MSAYNNTPYVLCKVTGNKLHLESDGHSYSCPACKGDDLQAEYYDNHELAEDIGDEKESGGFA